MDYKDKIAGLISEASGLGKKVVLSIIEIPPDPKLGNYAFPCFILAKQMKKSPAAIAKDLVKELEKPDFVETIEENGPYLNFFIKAENLGQDVIPLILKQKYDYGQGKANKTYMVEFFHANTHKGIHIGHIRNMCLGESLSRILEKNGIKVIRANYQGDIGPHVAKAVWGVLNLHKGTKPKVDRGVWLGKVYSEVNQLAKKDEKLEEELRTLTKDIYDSDKYKKVWDETRKWCLEDFDKMYKQFHVKFDRLYFESEVEKEGKEIVKKLVKSKIARESDGAMIVDFKDEGMGVFVVLRNDGVPLYSTKDLALAELKAKEYPKLDMSLHVVGKEQELYFKQLFRTFELYGGPLANKSHHMIYELVMLPEGKMSSREGNIVLYEDLKDKLFSTAEDEVRLRHGDWEENEIKKTSEKIAFAALKFSMLNRDNNKTLIFDWKKALEFEGETGPYLQYSVTRIASIMEKAGKLPKEADYSLLSSDEEKNMMGLLKDFPEAVKEAAKHYKPLLISKYLVSLAQQFNEFYHKHDVLKSEPKVRDARLLMLAAVKIVMESGLELLAIPVLEKM